MTLLLTAALVQISSTHCAAGARATNQTAGVDNTKMGAYRALAQLSLEAFQKGDSATAAELARILERTWDAAEGGGGDRSLVKTNKDLFEEADRAMDGFIKPIINFAAKTPDPTAVKTAYDAFLDKLRRAD